MAGRWHGQLEGCVEVVLLLLAAMHDLSVPHNDESTVANVCRVHRPVLPIKNQHTGRATTQDRLLLLQQLAVAVGEQLDGLLSIEGGAGDQSFAGLHEERGEFTGIDAIATPSTHTISDA